MFSDLMGNVVPEIIAQEICSGNAEIRRLTPDRMTVYAFGLYAGGSRAVSSLQVKRSWIFDQGSVYPAGVMYGGIICCCQEQLSILM